MTRPNSRRLRSLIWCMGLAALASTMVSWGTLGVAQETNAPQRSQPTQPADAPEVAALTDSTSILLREMRLMMDEIADLRRQLADCQLESTTAQRELAELRQFIRDNQALGEDFDEYQRIREIREQEARQRLAAEARRQRELEDAARAARRAELLALRNAQKAEETRVRRYTDAGFSNLGLDVYASKMAYAYRSTDSQSGWTQWYFGSWTAWGPLYDQRRVDFTQMIISGSVINAADEVRNVGIAMTFFDELGNQVGHEIVQIKNARPDVPYPFTSTIAVALNRPFDTSSVYVLYADPVEADAEAQAPPSP